MNSEILKKIKNKISLLPNAPGVYLMKDDSSNIIYIGKAKVLKNRVSSYFLHTQKPRKVMKMVERVVDFDYIITNSEYDALNLESNLIKKHRPFYNVLLKEAKAHAFLKIDFKKEYPVLEVTRTIKRDGAKYFGPYFSGVNVRDLLKVISSAFMLMDFNLDIKTDRPYYREYLNYFVSTKAKKNNSNINKEDYLQEVKKVVDFLNGDLDTAKNILLEKMKLNADSENFERAIEYRHSLELINKLKAKVITELKRDVNIDVFGFASDEYYSAVSVLVVRAGKMIGVNNYFIGEAISSNEETFNDFLMQYYSKNNQIPNELVVDIIIDETVNRWLQENSQVKVEISYSKKAIKKQLLNMAHKNAEEHLEKNAEKAKLNSLKTEKALQSLKEDLHLKTLPQRIECYDISNMQGAFIVASMVTFINGEPNKSHYRKFKIKNVVGKNNDFESMREVIYRRFNNLTSTDESFSKMPDLIVIDGGKGQLSSAFEILGELNINVDIISLAKQFEEVFVPNNSQSIFLNKNNYGLRLLQNIRDEAHRFAITFHRSLRNKVALSSELQNIEGIGDKTIIKLIAYFKDIEKIKTSNIDDLLKINGITKKMAANIYNYFNK